MNQKDYMSRIRNKSKEEVYIQVPRDIFKEISQGFKRHEATRYIDYGFSFLITNAFLYKYTHYVDIDEGEYLTMADMKILLKYSPKNDNINRITKKDGGILESEALVQITDDIPIDVEFMKSKGDGLSTRKIIPISEASYEMADEVRYNVLRTPKHYVYIPEFMIDYGNKYGTLNEYKKTTRLSYSEYEYFIINKDMTLKDFMVYFFIKTNLNKNGYVYISADRAKRNIGLGPITFRNVINKLEDNNIINVIAERNTSRYQKIPKQYSLTKKFIGKVVK